MFTRTLNALIAHRKLSAITRCCIGVSPAGPLATEGCYTTSNQGTAVDECIAQWRTNQKKTKRSRKGDTNVHDVKEALKNLRLNKQCQNRKVKFLETPLYSSTVFVVIVEYNKKQSNAMDNAWPDLELEIDQIPAAGAGGGAGARRCAVQRLLSKAKFPKNTFTQACLLSATTYEGEVLHGTLVPDTSAVKKTTIVAFAEPPYLAETKAARKLLEMSSDALALTTTAAGKLNKLVRLNEPKPDTTAVRFVNQLQWELKIGTTIRYTISANTVAVPAPKISKTELSARLTSTFGQTCDKNAIWDIVEAAIKQHHGTMVVISDHAAKEAERLGSQSTRLCNPMYVLVSLLDVLLKFFAMNVLVFNNIFSPH